MFSWKSCVCREEHGPALVETTISSSPCVRHYHTGGDRISHPPGTISSRVYRNPRGHTRRTWLLLSERPCRDIWIDASLGVCTFRMVKKSSLENQGSCEEVSYRACLYGYYTYASPLPPHPDPHPCASIETSFPTLPRAATSLLRAVLVRAAAGGLTLASYC